MLGAQPPGGGPRLSRVSLYPLDDDGAWSGSAPQPHPGYGPGFQPLPTVDSDRRGVVISQEVLQNSGSGDRSGGRHPHTLRLECRGIARQGERSKGAAVGLCLRTNWGISSERSTGPQVLTNTPSASPAPSVPAPSTSARTHCRGNRHPRSDSVRRRPWCTGRRLPDLRRQQGFPHSVCRGTVVLATELSGLGRRRAPTCRARPRSGRRVSIGRRAARRRRGAGRRRGRPGRP